MVLLVPLTGVLVLIAVGRFIPDSGLADRTPVSPPATIDDVYVALTSQMNGATPDFETQVKPVLALNLTYQALQELAAKGGLKGMLAAAGAAAPAAPAARAAPAAPAQIAAPAVTAAPILTYAVTMTQVLDVVRSQWGLQPQPICTRGGATCQPMPDLSRMSPFVCDHTGTLAVPASVSCTYSDSALGPGTLSIGIDANHVVNWRGCSLSDPRRPCVQAAPTQPPVVAPPPANAPLGQYCGREFISISDIGSPSGAKAILINGALIGYDSILRSPVTPGSYTVVIRNPDGTLRSSFNAQVPTCQGFTYRRN